METYLTARCFKSRKDFPLNVSPIFPDMLDVKTGACPAGEQVIIQYNEGSNDLQIWAIARCLQCIALNANPRGRIAQGPLRK